MATYQTRTSLRSSLQQTKNVDANFWHLFFFKCSSASDDVLLTPNTAVDNFISREFAAALSNDPSRSEQEIEEARFVASRLFMFKIRALSPLSTMLASTEHRACVALAEVKCRGLDIYSLSLDKDLNLFEFNIGFCLIMTLVSTKARALLDQYVC